VSDVSGGTGTERLNITIVATSNNPKYATNQRAILTGSYGIIDTSVNWEVENETI
jgi:hypothetical protein